MPSCRSYIQPEEDQAPLGQKGSNPMPVPTTKSKEVLHTSYTPNNQANSHPNTAPSSYITKHSVTCKLHRQSTEESETQCLLPSSEHEASPSCSDSLADESAQYGAKPGSSQVPVAGALFVATCLGTPVIALTGLKLGLFAAVGGGIMGFATGKMFAEHE